jgi:hypothetical protein
MCGKGSERMTIEEIESACERSQPLDFSRHALEAPGLRLREMFYPLGFPAEVRTNSAGILSLARSLWSNFEKRFDTKPIRVDVHVVEGESVECPPAPVVRMMLPLLVNMADTDNYSIADLDRGTSRIAIARSTEKYPSYLGYVFLGSSPLVHIATAHTTPVHAGCVAFDGRGMLLCGDSGAGKSSLAYACARAGWTYVTDDSSYLLNGGKDRLITGNCHQVRFRPSAAELFPEVKGLEITPRVSGKPSIELPTAPMTWMTRAPTAQVDFMVFLNRRSEGSSELVPYCKNVARHFMRQVLYGSAESLAKQYSALERLLTADVFELRYRDLDWAEDRLRTLAREGR